MKALAILLLLGCGVETVYVDPPPKDYGEACCTCWESWWGGCTAMRLERAPRFECEDRAPRPPLCESEVAALRDAGMTPDAGTYEQ